MWKVSAPCSVRVSIRPKNKVVRGSSCSEATRRASTRPSSSLVQASVALAASSRSVFSRIRRSSARAWSRWACSRASTSSVVLVVVVSVASGVSAVGAGMADPPLICGLVRILANR